VERRIKVLFVIGTLDVGGAETQLLELASRLNRALFDPIVVSMKTGGAIADRLRARGVQVHTLGFRRLRHRNPLLVIRSLLVAGAATLRLGRLMRRERPDVVHGMLLTAYVLATFVGRVAGVPVVVSSRRSLGNFKARKRLHLFLERIADRMTDLFVANSQAVRADTLAREKIDPDDIVVVYNGVDLDKFSQCLRGAVRAADAAASVDPPLGTPVAAVVANLIAYKGHTHFLDAWKRVVAQHPAAVAALVGEGPCRSGLERRTHELGIESNVKFLGLRDDVPALLCASDVVVHPSTEEGCPNAVLEAMAAERPIVATSVGGTVEAIVDGETGLLVPPCDSAALAEAICFILDNPEAARVMGAKARAAAESGFEIGHSVRQYEAIYQSLVSRRAKGPFVTRPAVGGSAPSAV
jgi:glycosyltransferase involved in cell wall biosynthesis